MIFDIKNYLADADRKSIFFLFCSGKDFLERGRDAFRIYKNRSKIP